MSPEQTADGPPTLGELLDRALEERLTADQEGAEAREGWSAVVREALDQALPRPGEDDGHHRVVRMVREALDVPVPDLLAAAWQRYEPFRRYRDPEVYPPGTETEVPLADHTARSVVEPEVDVMASGTVLATLRFEAEATLTFQGAVVRIRDGRFRSVRSGECSVAAELRFQGHTLAKRGPEKEVIPGELDFGPEGVPIDPFADDPYAPEDAPGG